MASPSKHKRVKLTDNELPDRESIRRQRLGFLNSISRPVSPPRTSEQKHASSTTLQSHKVIEQSKNQIATTVQESSTNSKNLTAISTTSNAQASFKQTTKTRTTSLYPGETTLIPSPFKLTRIRDLGPEDNVDTVTLHDILGNPLIKEAWVFNYCFDIDWMMQYFDEDVRESVKVRVVHGSWRKEDQNKILIDEACQRWTNVDSITAYLPDPFGTHHSKAFILFTHDECVEIVIHTANMIARDWTNMTQAVWRSPSLKKLDSPRHTAAGPLGSGSRFKDDLLAYFKAYGNKLRKMVDQLKAYDFGSIRGALVASVPCKLECGKDTDRSQDLQWGYKGLRNIVRRIATKDRTMNSIVPGGEKVRHLICQVSSIATLPKDWFEYFQNIIMSPHKVSMKNVSIVFPTASDVRNSLDGYAAGVSIHTKAQSKSHLRQISSLHPCLCKWVRGSNENFDSGRNLAAPHIKTYIQFKSAPTATMLPDVEWALLTSANLSTQAWGSEPKLHKDSELGEESYIHIQSFELGVVIWPSLFTDSLAGVTLENSDGYKEESEEAFQVESSSLKSTTDEMGTASATDNGLPQSPPARLVPVFRKDTPDCDTNQGACTLVGLRMPYDLPLTPYGADELPWSPQSSYKEQDSHGRVWLNGQ